MPICMWKPYSENERQLVGVRENLNREKIQRKVVLNFFFGPFGLSFIPTNCSWVSEDDMHTKSPLARLPKMLALQDSNSTFLQTT